MPRARHLGLLAAVFLLIAAAIGIAPAGAQSPARVVASSQVAAPLPYTITGVDLHDGQEFKVGATYELIGTMYGCGFTWQSASPWCGFGVSTSSSISGPWSTPKLLFPANAPDPYNPGHTYQDTCGLNGYGCFTPRMFQRSGWGPNDGVWILWFNGPWYTANGAPNAYIGMGCDGPEGPCGASAGAPYGTTHRPNLHQCTGANGYADIVPPDGTNAPALVCPMIHNAGLAEEQLAYWGVDGTGAGQTSVAGLSGVEATGVFKDAATGTWVMTYSDPQCGYCAGTQAGYATSPNQLGPWTAPANVGIGPANGRRAFSANSCGGQVDGITTMDGVPYQKLDLWTGSKNETTAGLRFEPLTYTPRSGVAGDGQPWVPALAPFTCT